MEPKAVKLKWSRFNAPALRALGLAASPGRFTTPTQPTSTAARSLAAASSFTLKALPAGPTPRASASLLIEHVAGQAKPHRLRANFLSAERLCADTLLYKGVAQIAVCAIGNLRTTCCS